MRKNWEAGVKGSSTAAHAQMSNDYTEGASDGAAALFDVTTNQSEMRGRSRERRGKEDLSWFDVTIYQGTGECDGWERNGGSAGSGRERELMCGFVCSSRRLVKWTVILAFNFPSAFSRKNRREQRSTREESRKKENEEIHISLLTNTA